MIFNMRNSLSASLGIGLLLVFSGFGEARETRKQVFGFVRLLNAVSAGTGKLEFLIDGESVRPAGYQLGNVTGGIALKPGSHKVKFRQEGVKEGETRVEVGENTTVILIPFAEEVPARAGDPAHWEIRILRLKQHESEDRRTASFVSVSREPEVQLEIRQADGKWQSVSVKRLGIARADITQARGYMPVRGKGGDLSAVSVGPSGNFVSVLYDDSKGVLRSKTFQDYKYLGTD